MKLWLYTLLSWVLACVAPVCIIMKMEPLHVQVASVFTIAGIALNWMVNKRPDILGITSTVPQSERQD